MCISAVFACVTTLSRGSFHPGTVDLPAMCCSALQDTQLKVQVAATCSKSGFDFH